MNFAAMLAYGPRLEKKPGSKDISAWITQEMREKGAATTARKRRERWIAVFSQLPSMRGGTSEIATITGRATKDVHDSLTQLTKLESPLIRKAGRAPTPGSTNKQIVWEWINE